MATNDVWHLTINCRLAGQLCQPGFHFRFKSESATPSGLIADWRQNAEVQFLNAVSQDLAIESYSAEQRVPGTASSVETILGTPVPGNVLEPSLPPADAVVLSLHTGLKSRRSRGRHYAPGATEAQQTLGQLTPAANALWLQYAGTVRNLYGAAGSSPDYALVVYSPENLTATPPRPGVIVTPVDQVTPDPVLRSQRRRQLGRGV